jgi:hypothetical protein
MEVNVIINKKVKPIDVIKKVMATKNAFKEAVRNGDFGTNTRSKQGKAVSAH